MGVRQDGFRRQMRAERCRPGDGALGARRPGLVEVKHLLHEVLRAGSHWLDCCWLAGEVQRSRYGYRLEGMSWVVDGDGKHVQHARILPTRQIICSFVLHVMFSDPWEQGVLSIRQESVQMAGTGGNYTW